jgi:hypothetical protein
MSRSWLRLGPGRQDTVTAAARPSRSRWLRASSGPRLWPVSSTASDSESESARDSRPSPADAAAYQSLVGRRFPPPGYRSTVTRATVTVGTDWRA